MRDHLCSAIVVCTLTLGISLEVLAESPGCACSLGLSGTVTSSPTLDCLSWESAGESCDGTSVNVGFTNGCADDVVIDSSSLEETTVKPGESAIATWVIPAGNSAPKTQDLSLSFDAKVGGETYKLSYIGVLTCSGTSDAGDTGGCTMSATAPASSGWIWALLMGAGLVLARMRGRRHEARRP